jgi:hypothetical protein
MRIHRLMTFIHQLATHSVTLHDLGYGADRHAKALEVQLNDFRH